MRLTQQLDEGAGALVETVVHGTLDTLCAAFEWIDAKAWRKALAGAALIVCLWVQWLDWQSFRNAQAIRLTYDLAWVERMERYATHHD